METEEATNTLYGLFMQETLRPNDHTAIDIGFRYDRNNFDIHNIEYTEYNYRTGRYSTHGTPIVTDTDKTFNLFSPKFGITYAVTDIFNVYGMIAQSGQVPSESEIQSNPSLDAATARNIEVGLKGRTRDWSMDMSLYSTTITDDIISVWDGNTTEFQNAGETLKNGFEFSGRTRLNDYFWLGAGYAYSDYQFENFIEWVRVGRNLEPVDRSGNQIPYLPKHQFNLSLEFNHPAGYKARLQADSWGEYYTDNTNDQIYGGYDFLTSLMLGYEKGPHSLTLNIDNLFDKRYAIEVKGVGDDASYSAGAPRSAMVSYTYKF